MESQAHLFKKNAGLAVKDANLKAALGTVRYGLVNERLKAISVVPDFELMRDRAKQLKQHTLSHLDYYLEEFEKTLSASGGRVHWAKDAAQANQIIIDICRQHDAKTVAKGKSMAGEEIGINQALEDAGIEPIETDLGEYIVQLANEPPSHIIVPAVHKSKQQIIDLFTRKHNRGENDPALREVSDIVAEARCIMREKFLSADIGMTGANFLVAETGSAVLVTNEGNGDLCSTLPKVHIVTAGIEKVVPNLDSVALLTRLLARSATGQETTAYTSFFTGSKRIDDKDGPEEMHVVLIDNGRTDMLNSELNEMLRCIRCGACINHCPVYGAVGGHTYGWVYPGPMGSVLTPAILGLEEAGELPNACTLNGRCGSVCPVKIPLPKMLRQLRARQFKMGKGSQVSRVNLWLWKQLVIRPKLYHFLLGQVMPVVKLIAGKKGRIRRMPLLGAWLKYRDLASPQGETFQSQWKRVK